MRFVIANQPNADYLLQNPQRPIIFIGHSLGGLLIEQVCKPCFRQNFYLGNMEPGLGELS